MILKKNEDNENEVLFNQNGFELTQEDDDLLIDDDLSEDFEPKESSSDVGRPPRIEESKYQPQGTTAGGDILSQLGPYRDTPDVLLEPVKTCLCITDWEALYPRYKPENICKDLLI